jgi:hypothetical protein
MLLVGMGLGCVTGTLAPYNLPEQPIALLYWDDRTAGKRAKVFTKAEEQNPARGDFIASDRARGLDVRLYLRGDESVAMRERMSENPGRLMLYWPRTGELERVAAAPLGAVPLAWSEDRRTLLFASNHRGDDEQLYEYNLDRKDLSPVTSGRLEYPRGDFAGNGHWLVQRVREGRRADGVETTIHLMSPGGRLGPVLGRDVPSGMLRVGPNAEWVVYEQVREIRRPRAPLVYESWIAIRSLLPGPDGKPAASVQETILAKGRDPALTPDGLWIVFASESSAGYRLRRMRLDGSAKVAIGPGGTEERMPMVSPDGEFVAFVQAVDGQRKLTVRSFDGKKQRVLLSNGWSEFPVW